MVLPSLLSSFQIKTILTTNNDKEILNFLNLVFETVFEQKLPNLVFLIMIFNLIMPNQFLQIFMRVLSI